MKSIKTFSLMFKWHSLCISLLNVSSQMIIGSDGQLWFFVLGVKKLQFQHIVFCFLQELSAHLISINSERKAIYVMFTTFEEIWKFTTYYKIGMEYTEVEVYVMS